MEPDAPPNRALSADRERYWRRKLGRLRPGSEPIAWQLERYRRVTVMLTAVPAGLALMFVALFTAFRRPDVGAIVASILFLPVVVIAWADYALLRHRARAYLREVGDPAETGREKTPPTGAADTAG